MLCRFCIITIVFVFGILFCVPAPPAVAQVTFTPSTEDFANPERGFMRQANVFVDQPLDVSKISAVQPSDSLVWVYFHLENYRDPRDGKGITLTNYQGKALDPIGSGKGLDTVQATFTEARKKGLKLVIRFLYIGYGGIGSTQDPNQKEPDAPLSLVQQHLTQLTPLLQQHKDVIATVQTGFVGYWGEWHSSKYLDSLASRKAVTDALLAAVPQDRMIMLRYPRYKQLWYGGPLTDAQAFSESDVARVGIHDDAFLKDETDDGTFKSTTGTIGKITTFCDTFPAGEIACWRDYLQKDGTFVPVGGEAGTHSNPPSPLANCPNALTQMNNTHQSFLHNGYAKVVLDTWVNQGCMPEIRRRLGYRLTLKQATIPTSVQPGGTLGMHITLRNEGFASMYNSRPVFLVLRNGSMTVPLPLPSVDPRRWYGGQDHTLPISVTIPATVVPGTYQLGLWLPDQATTLRQNPAYAVRFANANVWDPASGINILSNTFLVTTGTPVPTIPGSLTATPSLPPISSTPPPTCALKSRGDATCDGQIRLSDYDAWRREFFGEQPTKTADFNNDGNITITDHSIWRQSFFDSQITPTPTTGQMSTITVATAAIITTSPDSPDPSDLAFNTKTGKITIVDGEVEEPPYNNPLNFLVYTRGTNLTLQKESTTNITSTTREPVGITIDTRHTDPSFHEYYVSDDERKTISVLAPGADGIITASDTPTRVFHTPSTSDPEGIAFDTSTGTLYFTDALGHTLYHQTAGADGIINGIAPEGDDVLTLITDTLNPNGSPATGIIDPEGMTINEERGILALVTNGGDSNMILEMDKTGRPIRKILITGASITAASGITTLPDTDPSFITYAITDRGIDNNNPTPGIQPNDGRIIIVQVPNS